MASVFAMIDGQADDEPTGSTSESSARTASASSRATWMRLSRQVPRQIADLLRTIDVPSFRVEVLERVEQRLFGWMAGRRVATSTVDRRVTPVEVQRAYGDALASDRRDQTLRLVRRHVDDRKHEGFHRRLMSPEERAAEPPPVPKYTSKFLFVSDPSKRTDPTYGVRSFLEATPVQVPAYVLHILTEFGGRSVGGERPARALDLTAGSSTVADVVRSLGGVTCECDLSPLNEDTHPLDLRGCRRRLDRRYDVIFIHPPSTGGPGSLMVDGLPVPGDLAAFSREAWTDTVGTAINVALELLLPTHGLLSVLVPEGSRDHQRVSDIPGVVDELVERLPEDAFLVSRLRLRWSAPARQVSLGKNRVPTTHLLIAREWWS